MWHCSVVQRSNSNMTDDTIPYSSVHDIPEEYRWNMTFELQETTESAAKRGRFWSLWTWPGSDFVGFCFYARYWLSQSPQQPSACCLAKKTCWVWAGGDLTCCSPPFWHGALARNRQAPGPLETPQFSSLTPFDPSETPLAPAHGLRSSTESSSTIRFQFFIVFICITIRWFWGRYRFLMVSTSLSSPSSFSPFSPLLSSSSYHCILFNFIQQQIQQHRRSWVYSATSCRRCTIRVRLSFLSPLKSPHVATGGQKWVVVQLAQSSRISGIGCGIGCWLERQQGDAAWNQQPGLIFLQRHKMLAILCAGASLCLDCKSRGWPNSVGIVWDILLSCLVLSG